MVKENILLLEYCVACGYGEPKDVLADFLKTKNILLKSNSEGGTFFYV